MFVKTCLRVLNADRWSSSIFALVKLLPQQLVSGGRRQFIYFLSGSSFENSYHDRRDWDQQN